MGRTTYQATGVFVGLLKKVLGVRLRVTGTENLVQRPTLFVANHFTRIETFLVPYVIYRYAGRQVRSLGTHSVFKGLFGRYFEALGGMSTRHPRRNRTIMRELMTGAHDWVIYPEGGLIKNKKIVHRGRYRLDHPEREGPPHTGAAMLALKAETSKRRYLEACEEDELRRIEYYEETLGINGPREICPQGIVMTPVTLSFYPMRPSRNLLNRLAKFVIRDLDPRIDEELTVEGSILLKGTEIIVHIGEPIEVGDYLGRVVDLARRVAGLFSEESRTDLFLRKQARKLTDACMRNIYNNVEVSLDHLLSYGLRVLERDRIGADDLRAAMFLAARELAERDDVRLHPSLRNGVTALVTGEEYDPWDAALALARKEGVVSGEASDLVVDRTALGQAHEFHTIRLQKMMQVIANEIEPVKPVVDAVRRIINLSDAEIRARTAAVLHRAEVEVFDRDYTDTFDPESSKPRDLGEPFLLDSKGATTGVVLVHGYLASPEQLRPLATFLHERGFTVYAVRLPGHGTAPDQLTEVTWRDWLESVVRGYALIRQHAPRVVVGGFSLGGALALLLAARRPDGIDGVFAINAPLKIRDRRAPLVGPLARWNGALRHLGLANGHYRFSNEGTEDPDLNYATDYLLGVRELKRTAGVCRRRLPEVRAPALVIQADDDPLVSAASGNLILGRLGSEDKILSTVPSDRHLVVRGPGSPEVFELVARFVQRVSGPQRLDGDEAMPRAS